MIEIVEKPIIVPKGTDEIFKLSSGGILIPKGKIIKVEKPLIIDSDLQGNDKGLVLPH